MGKTLGLESCGLSKVLLVTSQEGNQGHGLRILGACRVRIRIGFLDLQACWRFLCPKQDPTVLGWSET